MRRGPLSSLSSNRRRSRNSPANIVAVSSLCRRDLPHQRKDPLILNGQHLKEAPLSCVGKRWTLVLPHVVADNPIRTACTTCEIGIDQLLPTELHRTDLVNALGVRL